MTPEDRIDNRFEYGVHIELTCKNHPLLRWSTKNIGYIGARTIFYVTWKQEECVCPTTDLIVVSLTSGLETHQKKGIQMIRPTERKKRLPIEISNWALQYVGENDPLNLYNFAIAAYELGFEDAERIAEQKENEEKAAQFPPVTPAPLPFLISADPECELTKSFPKHAPGVLQGCTCKSSM